MFNACVTFGLQQDAFSMNKIVLGHMLKKSCCIRLDYTVGFFLYLILKDWALPWKSLVRWIQFTIFILKMFFRSLDKYWNTFFILLLLKLLLY